jgi:hypothetical protein
MACPIFSLGFFPAFAKRFKGLCRSLAGAPILTLTRPGSPAYIGGGPRLPNEALSFWKE